MYDQAQVDMPFNEIILELAKNAKHITPELQRAIALYVEFAARPVLQIKGEPFKLQELQEIES